MNRAKPTTVRRPSAAAKPSGARRLLLRRAAALPGVGGRVALGSGGFCEPRVSWDSCDGLQDATRLVPNCIPGSKTWLKELRARRQVAAQKQRFKADCSQTGLRSSYVAAGMWLKFSVPRFLLP